MDTLPTPETIREIATLHFLQQKTSDQVSSLVWPAENDGWQYRVLGKWMQTTTFLITLWNQKFALKLSNNEKFKWDTDTELWLRQQGQNTPQIFNKGEWQLPGMEGRYFWSVQEYIPGPLWKDAEINDAQLKSFIAQLDSLHAIRHDWTTGWGMVMPDRNGGFEDFAGNVGRFVGKIQKCDFFSEDGRRERVLEKIQEMKSQIGDMAHYRPVLIHNDAHTANVIIDTPESVRLLDFGNVRWSCPEEELAVIQTHCVGSRMSLFTRILDTYRADHSFDNDLFEFFSLLNACSKINTRKITEKQLLIWWQIVEPLLQST